MATKKNLVSSMLMSVATAGIFSFTFVFTSCNDDEILEGAELAPGMEQEYNGPLLEPYGLSFYDFVTGNDVTILNADTTEISVNKALADKLGIESFLGHPMGIWDHPEHRAYLRRATKEKLEGDRYILHVTQSSIAEVLAGNDKEIKMSTELYVNTDPASTRTRALENNTPEYAARYIDENNVLHPMAITFKRAGGDQGALTRNDAAENNIYGTYLPEHLLGMQNDPATRAWWNDLWKGVKDVFGTVGYAFEKVAYATEEWFKAKTEELEKYLHENTAYDIDWDGHNTLINIESSLEKKVPIQCGEDSNDTINVYVKTPVKFNLNYNIVMQAEGSLVAIPHLSRFEASVDGRFNFEPEIRLGFDGKLELPDDKQKVKLAELDGFSVIFTIGYVPFTVDFNPSMFLKFKAEVGGRATVGVKYEFDSWFKGGIAYDGSPKGINDSKVTKSKVCFLKPSAEFSAEAGIGLMLGCEMIIDKVAGPEVAIGPNLTASADLTLSPFDQKDPVNFEASVDFKFSGEAGGKLKIWKWELGEWKVPLNFGLNKNIFKYPSDDASYEVKKNVDDVYKLLVSQIEHNHWIGLGSKLMKDPEVHKYAVMYLAKGNKAKDISSEKLNVINRQRPAFIKNYGRSPLNNDEDFQPLKQMTIDEIKMLYPVTGRTNPLGR